jgi:hypothetical protein
MFESFFNANKEEIENPHSKLTLDDSLHFTDQHFFDNMIDYFNSIDSIVQEDNSFSIKEKKESQLMFLSKYIEFIHLNNIWKSIGFNINLKNEVLIDSIERFLFTVTSCSAEKTSIEITPDCISFPFDNKRLFLNNLENFTPNSPTSGISTIKNLVKNGFKKSKQSDSSFNHYGLYLKEFNLIFMQYGHHSISLATLLHIPTAFSKEIIKLPSHFLVLFKLMQIYLNKTYI